MLQQRLRTRSLATLVVALGVASLGWAQQPGGSSRPGSPSSQGDDSMVLPGVDSILRYRSWHEDMGHVQIPGFRNPGGVGLTNQYYPSGDKFQNDSPKHITAKIGLGGVPDRAEQLAAFNAGTARYNALQTHIDRYGRPMMGFGMGFGFGR